MKKYYFKIRVNGKRVSMHRYVMEQYLGRELDPNEYIHHKDLNIHNNSIDNLEILSRSDHLRLHHAGKKLSEMTRNKIRFRILGVKLSEETRKKMSISRLGNKNSYGKKRSEESKKKMSISQTGRKHSEESRKKRSLKRLGFKYSESSKQKMSISRKKYCENKRISNFIESLT